MRQKSRRLRDCAGGKSKFNHFFSLWNRTLRNPQWAGQPVTAFIQHSLARYGFLFVRHSFVRHSKVTIAPLKSGGSSMDVERAVRMIAGVFVLLSLALGYWVSPYWYLFTAFVGLNLFQSAFTKWCPMTLILQKCGMRSA